MGVLIVAGTVGLAVALVQKLGGGAAGAGPIALGQPAGTTIQGISQGEGTVAVWVRRPAEGDRVLLVDPRRSRVTGEIRLGD
jgi:hypothetical protein